MKAFLRNILGICKDHLNYITMADCKHFRGDAIDLETFTGNIIRWKYNVMHDAYCLEGQKTCRRCYIFTCIVSIPDSL